VWKMAKTIKIIIDDDDGEKKPKKSSEDDETTGLFSDMGGNAAKKMFKWGGK